VPAIDFVCRREFDFSIVEYANGKPLTRSSASVTRRSPQRRVSPASFSTILTGAGYPEQLDEMPWATEIYARDLDVTRYNVPFLLHPFVSLYSTRGCRRNAPSACGRRRSAATRGASVPPTM